MRVVWDGSVEYRGSLARMGGACAMVLCRKDVVAQLGKKAGDLVHVPVELDTVPRTVDVPDALREALEAHPGAAAAWEALAPSCKRAYAGWIADARKNETRARRVSQAVPMILQGKRFT